MRPSTWIAWENGPSSGASSGEVIAILLMETPFDTGLDGQNGGAGGGARFQCLVGVCSVLERKALIDVNAHLSRSDQMPAMQRGRPVAAPHRHQFIQSPHATIVYNSPTTASRA